MTTFGCRINGRIPWLTVFLFVLSLNILQAQDRKYNYAFHSLTESEGLSDGVNAWIYKDRSGFIWISSMDGLNRFDGQNVKTYRPDPSDPNSLSDNIVTSTFYEDEEGNLWFTTYGAINVYQRKYDHFESFHLEDSEGQAIVEDYFAFHMDSTGHLWLRTGLRDAARMHWFDTENKRDSIIQPLKGQRLSVIDLPGQNDMILSSRFVDGPGFSITTLSANNSSRVRSFFDQPDNSTLPATNIYNILTQDYPTLWMASDLGLIKFDIKSNTVQIFNEFRGQPTGRIKSIARYQNRILTSSKGIGLLNFDLRTETFESNLLPEVNNKYSIRRKDISNLHIDRDECIWLSYYEDGLREGLDYSDLKRYRFPTFKFIKGPTLRSSDIAKTPDGNVFVARNNQVVLVDQDLKIIDRWTFDKDIRLIRTDHQGRTWVVFERDGYSKYSISCLFPSVEYWTNMGSTEYVIEDLQCTVDNKVLLATRKGVHEVKIKKQEVAPFSGFPEISDFWVFEIFQDKQGYLYFATNYDRIYIYPDSGPQVQPSAHFTGVGYCNSFYQWAEGDKTWVSSSMGLGEIRLEGNSFKFISGPSNILPQQKYFDIIVVDSISWIKSERGLYKFNIQDSTISLYERVDGVVRVVGNRASTLVDQRGRVWISGKSGINIFHPGSIKSVTSPPTPQIVKIEVNDESYGAEISHNTLDSLDLKYNQNTVSFEFVPCQFGDPGNIRFQYRLVGYDDAWVESRTAGYARYYSLPAGSYTFEARTGNSDGDWSTIPARIEMVISPPLWATAWAYVLYALIFIGLIGNWRRNERIKQEKKLEAQKKKVEQERRVNDELRKIDKLKDQFLANTSHELRTPLNGIIGLAESLIDGATGELPTKTQSNLAMIASSGKRLSNLVNDILDFSKIKSNDLRLELKAVDLFSAVDIVMTLLNPLRRNSSVTMLNTVRKDLPRVRADENRLQQILYNLIGNAIKFTRQGEITVAAEVKGEEVMLSIRDTGIGIDQGDHENIFKSFEQVDGSTEREFGGTGLGLSVTKQLVELHSGKIWLTSKPKVGSTFFFTLKCAGADMEPIPSEYEEIDLGLISKVSGGLESFAPSIVSQNEDLEDHSILIVDDEPVNRQVLENHLTTAGYPSMIAKDGEEAIAAVRSGKIGLILLDIMMPGLSGFEVCQRVRKEHSAIALPIIMLTAKNRVSDLVEGFTLGANDYLTKPFSKDELLARIQTHLSLRKIYSATGKFVPFEFLNAIGHDQITNVNLGDHSLVEVSVLFADIREYTRISESMTPTENFNFVNAFVGRMGPVIQEHHGFVNQYLGDGIMAIFPTSPQNAIEAATGMARKLREYNVELEAEGKEALRMGIGLHSGPLIMGIIGDEHRSDPATIADTVNTSSRLEGLTKYYKANVIVSEECLNDYSEQEKRNFRFLGNVQLKGKTNAISIYESILGDPPEIAEFKLKTFDSYQSAIEDYLSGRFQKAYEKFDLLHSEEPRDLVVSFFLDKVLTLIEGGTPPDWEAIEIMTTK